MARWVEREEFDPDDPVSEFFHRIRLTAKNPPKLARRARKLRMEPGREDLSVPGIAGKLLGNSKKREQCDADEETQDTGDERDIHSISSLKRYTEIDNYQGYQEGRPSGADGRRVARSIGVPSLGMALGREIIERGWQQDLAHGWIMGHWALLVGERIAAHTRPEKIDGQTVYIQTDNSNWATELRYLQHQIIKRIAETIGPDVVTELKIVGPKQHRNYQGRMWVKPQGSQDTYG
ncbi:DciA family protein [Corynebacterium sp. 32222D000AT]|uniref:DciA family protein n=1 Tax=unclassified Corynebacterium TaxID=2624378 RepID=UPI002A95FD4D|nr:DciA family protein [Mycobacteriaceae bacterium]MDY5829197.1 DciA family protein [Corynebacterium sp.]